MPKQHFTMIVLVLLTLLLTLSPQGFSQPTVGVYAIQAGESLSTLAQQNYGNMMTWPAIMFSTNRRLNDRLGLQFIGDPNQLDPGQKVWLPDEHEKRNLIAAYRAYVQAIHDASLPESYEIAKHLRTVSPDEPVLVVTWARENQYAEPGTITTTDDTWVTVVPELKAFCQALTLDAPALTLRLEQWLGLPPSSNKTIFVEMAVDNPKEALFRPCPDPRIDTPECPIAFPTDISQAHQTWIMSQYYSAFSHAQPTRFPWTALGYTYDWGESKTHVGASEFIIRKGATVTVESITPTKAYCAKD